MPLVAEQEEKEEDQQKPLPVFHRQSFIA